MAQIPPFTSASPSKEETDEIARLLQQQQLRKMLPDTPSPPPETPPPPPETLNNRELQQAIVDAQAMLLEIGPACSFYSTLEHHFVQLLAVQRHRAGLCFSGDP
jgi:hypothetical protein